VEQGVNARAKLHHSGRVFDVALDDLEVRVLEL
jgi:hypothetical protein